MKDRGEGSPRLAVARGECERLLEMGHRLVRPTRARQELAQLEMRRSVGRVSFEGVRERALGRSCVTLRSLQRAQAGPCGRVPCSQAHGLLVGFDRALGLAHQLEEVAETLPRRCRDRGIEVGSRVARA